VKDGSEEGGAGLTPPRVGSKGEVLPRGKLNLGDLERLVLRHLPRVPDQRSIPLDYATAKAEGRLIAATDPVIGVPRDCYGFFALHYSAADVAMAGAAPRYLTIGVYYPPGTPESWLEESMRQLGLEARKIGVQVLGGHTGGYDGLTVPLISSTCLGLLPSSWQPPGPPKPGDMLIAAGPIARETLWFLAHTDPEWVGELLGERERRRLAADLTPFALTPVALELWRITGVTLLHDLAEGGLATALLELHLSTGLGATINYEEIPWDNQALLLCQHREWNPLSCSSFGSLLAVVQPQAIKQVLETLHKQGRPASVIGTLTKKPRLLLTKKGKTRPLKPGHDPYRNYTRKLE